MYISARKHILSGALFAVAVLKILCSMLEILIRFFAERTITSPDMLDRRLWEVQLGLSALQILGILLIFTLSWRRLQHLINIIPAEDRRDMGDLQKEYLGEKLPSLPAESLRRLLQLWTAIFVGAEIMYDLISVLYRQFIAILIEALFEGHTVMYDTFLILYNMTHGFKYLNILTAILFGFAVTGVVLNDRTLKGISVIVLALFFLACFLFRMQTITLLGHQFGIVWTSVIYHGTETLGLLCLSIYMAKRYRGL